MTFLIADDHIINLMLIENFLETYDVRILKATNGHEAWNIWMENQIDVVITDHYMPLMDGLELILKIKSSNIQKTTCMLITGEKNFKFIGPDYVYFKPIVKDEFDDFMNKIFII